MPKWFDADTRVRNYPTDEYFVGFAQSKLAKRENADKAIEGIKDAARVEAVSTIRVHVQSVQRDFSRLDVYMSASGEIGKFYQRFETNTTLTTDLEVPGLKIESYRDGNTVAAFAYVKRYDLQRQLEKQITMDLTRLETQMDNAEELIKNGQKAEARKRIAELGENFTEIERKQELLLAVNSAADTQSLQLDETKALQQRYTQMTAALKNGIRIALQCKAQIFDAPYASLQSEIKGKLAEIGCTFTDRANEADWVIDIAAKAREFRAENYGKTTTYFVYVDSQITITNQVTKQKVYVDEISVKGGDTRGNQDAARAAYKDTAARLSEIIKAQINQ